MITLLKHEYVRTWSMLALVGGAMVLVALVGALLGATGWPVLSTFGTIFVTIVAFVLVPTVQILLAVHYWQSSYGPTGYLTQTLPVKGSTIYWAKMIWAWLVSLVAVAVSAGIGLGAAELIATGSGSALRIDVSLREGWSALVDVAPPWLVAAIVAAFVALILVWPTQYFFAASLGSQAPMNRLGAGGPVLVWLGTYVAVQVVTFLGFAALPFAVGMEDGELTVVPFDLFAEMIAGTSPQVVPIGFVPAIVLTTIACLVWSLHSWKRRVSLV